MWYQNVVNVPSWKFPGGHIHKEDYGCRFLPFQEKVWLSSGGQGTVWRVKIHRDHFDPDTQTVSSNISKQSLRCALNHYRNKRLREYPDENFNFAMKEFVDADDFQDEFDALNLVRGNLNGYEHLIKALAAFSHGRKNFLIFPLAKGNLVKFWQQWGSSPRNVSWMLTQCHGIMEGLQRIHQLRSTDPSNDIVMLGRHGDIKPQNILWFADAPKADRLVLSDFTLMRFHEKGKKQETTMDRISGTRTYRAPEVEVMSHHHVSQMYDVWSLGCVFLEFISCHLAGYDATRNSFFTGSDGQRYQSFRTTREMDDAQRLGYFDDKFFFYTPGTAKAQVKESVGQVR